VHRKRWLKARIMLENPRCDLCFSHCDVLDELKAPALHSTAGFAGIGQPVTADRMLHKL
jgi:hypothetical protein